MRKLIYVDPDKLEKIEHGRRAEGKPHSLGELVSEPGSDLGSAVRNCIGALSPREKQVVKLLLKGNPVREIAKRLRVSRRNIYKIRENAIEKIKEGCEKNKV